MRVRVPSRQAARSPHREPDSMSPTLPARPALVDLEQAAPFATRHIGPDEDQQAKMLALLGAGSLDELTAAAVPEVIAATRALDLPAGRTEAEVLAELRDYAAMNRVTVPMIGLGYSGTHTPPVVLRNVLENPAWYTAYTPYQPEISQGRLEALLNFQTVVTDLTGLPIAGASLLDEATASAEAMTLARRSSKSSAEAVFLLDADCLPQTIAVVQTRAKPLGIPVRVVDMSTSVFDDVDVFGILVQYPGASGAVRDLAPVLAKARERGAVAIVAADLLALTLLKSPGELGADVAVGSSQRFGVPLGYGGPHAGYMAVRHGLERTLPGRLVGVSVDIDGNPAYRLALQTREQHIRREKATSNICTAQVLLAVIAGMYAVFHGPEGLRDIARRAARMANLLGGALSALPGTTLVHEQYFDTLTVTVPGRAREVVGNAAEAGVDLRLVDDDTVAIATDETTTRAHLDVVVTAFGATAPDWDALDGSVAEALPEGLARQTPFMSHPVFSQHRSETGLLRYLRRLSDRDLALDRTMIPLGSCTMKLNATTEMEPVTWPEFGGLHPFAPAANAQGYRRLIDDLSRWLCEITGYDAVSLQPNAGSQGEFAGLLAIRSFHLANGDDQRDVCLIPASAHGTNAASAVMAGMRVVVVATAPSGDVDVDDLRAKIAQHGERLAALMVTYPSTHGVFEDTISDVCASVHAAGGQVYVDGANLNALVGLARPGEFGADVSHLNLHKTFCIPHGGGGPGVGPIGVAEHLAPYLPGHPLVANVGGSKGIAPVSGAPWGSASILPISWAYIKMMGARGLTHATKITLLNANYILSRLKPHYPILYTNTAGRCAHEFILDVRGFKATAGIEAIDVAKRLQDYGFHAPTMSWPVANTLMIEPTESESKVELDRFCDALIEIRKEIKEVEDGVQPREKNVLRMAPHTMKDLITGEWDRSYGREKAAYPLNYLREKKFWPSVTRLDDAYGDMNLFCRYVLCLMMAVKGLHADLFV